MNMFEQFFLSMQQDFKLFLFFPFICAIFRAIFICQYKPYPSLSGRWKTVWHCFRFGFWWGMDLNAYVFLTSFVIVTIPSLFIPYWYIHADMIRIILGCIYAIVLYMAFVGKMIFYANFHDIFNHIVLLGEKAEKSNLVDIFFNEHHGILFLIAGIPYLVFCSLTIKEFLSFFSVPYPVFIFPFSYLFNIAVVLLVILGFYYIRYGGNLSHDKKPEWDTIPDDVKDDPFLAKATVDDLISLRDVIKHPMKDILKHTDKEYMDSIKTAKNDLGVILQDEGDAFRFALHTAKGARINQPSHIFLIVGESYTQFVLDDQYACLHGADGGKTILSDPHTFSISNFLSSGIISRPSIVGLMSGIFDAGLELNEKEVFWSGTVSTSLPIQLRKLGYKTSYWYGGSVAHGNFNHFAPACGFDYVHSATDICGSHAPTTYVGVYDHLFLDKAAEMISNETNDSPVFHFLYTTSHHSPYKIDVSRYGYNVDKIMPDAPDDVKRNKNVQKWFGSYWYCDKALSTFYWKMKKMYPDSLFIVTGDHGLVSMDLMKTSLMNREYTFREFHCPAFMINHPDLTNEMFAGNTIGGHMNILPTIIELIAPKEFQYYSLVKSLLEPLSKVVTPYHWITKDIIGGYEENLCQKLTVNQGANSQIGVSKFNEIAEAEKNLTAYLLHHPDLLKSYTELLTQ